MSQPDGKGISRSAADRRYAQMSGLRAVTALPFGHNTGITTNDTTNAVYKDLTFFNIFKITEATDHVILEFDNFHTDTASGETTGGMITISASVWIRSASGSATFWGPKLVTFNGETNYNLYPRTRILADITDLGGVPADTEIRVHVRVQAETGVNYPKGRLAAWGSQGYMAGDQITNGSPTLTADTGYAPCGIWRIGDTCSALALFGDSRIFGTGETTGLTGGYAARQCYALDIGTVLAARSGERIEQWIANYSYRQNRMALAARCPYALLGWGINDLAAGRTYAQLVSDFQTLIGWLYEFGTKSIIPTIMPYTKSSDSYATASGQSRSDSFPAQGETDRQLFNTNLRNGSLASTFGPGYQGFIDPCVYIEVNASNTLTLNGGRFLATGSTGAAAMTTDGLHINTLGNTTVMPCISADLGNLIRRGAPVPRISQLISAD